MDEREMIKLWVDTWNRAAPELEAMRKREVAEADNVHVLALLEDAFNHAAESLPPRSHSGLVEMQRYFAKLRS